MKGQFMVLSSIIVGLIVISLAATISDIQTEEYDTVDLGYTVQTIKGEISEIDVEDTEDRENFERFLSKTDYQTNMDYWSEESCLNVTVWDAGDRAELDCLS